MAKPMTKNSDPAYSGNLLISLHDATPFHLPRLKKAEVFFQELGIEKITYLLIPEYHGSHLSSSSSEFIDWCRGTRPFSVEWYLHGYHHLENPMTLDSKSASLADGFKRKFMTGGEGEFLALDQKAIRDKVGLGREVFKTCLGYYPQGFVAPAWLFNSGLAEVLQSHAIKYTEDHGRLYHLELNQVLPSPVITWATRTMLRKFGSRLVCPLLERVWASAPNLRIAMHPFDFDHPSIVENIRHVLQRLMAKRRQAFIHDLDFK